MAFSEFFFDKDSFQQQVKNMHDDAKSALMREWEDAQNIPWFRRMQLMHDPHYLINQLKQGRYLPSFCVERICLRVLFTSLINLNRLEKFYSKNPL